MAVRRVKLPDLWMFRNRLPNGLKAVGVTEAVLWLDKDPKQESPKTSFTPRGLKSPNSVIEGPYQTLCERNACNVDSGPLLNTFSESRCLPLFKRREASIAPQAT